MARPREPLASILIVSTLSGGQPAGRMPRALARAGAEVALLVPEGAIAAATRHARRIGRFPADASAQRMAEVLLATVAATSPRAIVPADAGALHFLAAVVRAPGLRPALADDLALRLARSIGPLPAADASVDAAGLEQLRGAGVPLDPWRDDEDRDASVDVVQVDAVAHEGKLIASIGVEALVGGRLRGTPLSVVRFVAAPAATRAAAVAIAALGLAGWCTFAFASASGASPRLVAIERHLSPTMHRAAWAGVDLAAHWLAALDACGCDGAAALAAGAERTSVIFPREWNRDRASRWLREHPVDVPWDDPELLEAIVAAVLARDRGAQAVR